MAAVEAAQPLERHRQPPGHSGQINRLQQQIRYWRRSAQESDNELQEFKLALKAEQLTIVGKRRKHTALRSNLSLTGGYKLAMQRNIGHASADALLSHMDAPVTRYTVSRWEMQLASTIIAWAKTWHGAHYAWLLYCHDQCEAGSQSNVLSYELHLVAADATNTAVSLGTKAHVCKVTSLFRHVDLPVNVEIDAQVEPKIEVKVEDLLHQPPS